MKTLKKGAKATLVGIIRFYCYCISPLTPPCCRFYPSCSSYALQALERFGLVQAILLSTRRILRCHPGGSYGYDPVPLLKPAEHQNG